jgi:hypothetical protein
MVRSLGESMNSSAIAATGLRQTVNPSHAIERYPDNPALQN